VPTTPTTRDGRLIRGARTRAAVLDAAVSLATVHGLDGLSLARLADTLGVSKSGLFAHWRSKEELQLAAVERAREQVIEQVVRPALHAPRGVRRLWALHDNRMRFYAEGVLPGGCFFAGAAFEFDVRPGAVRDRLAAVLDEWIGLLRGLAQQAIDVGDLRPDTDPEQLAFEIDALGLAVIHHDRLRSDPTSYTRARAAVRERLRAACTDPGLLPEA